jgi:hypothetical protein
MMRTVLKNVRLFIHHNYLFNHYVRVLQGACKGHRFFPATRIAVQRNRKKSIVFHFLQLDKMHYVLNEVLNSETGHRQAIEAEK